jgi:hypothetical protein
MPNPLRCARCGSDKIIPTVSLRDYYGDTGTWSNTARVGVDGKPDAVVFKDRAYGDVTLDICGACGHADVSVANHEELYEKFRRSQDA